MKLRKAWLLVLLLALTQLLAAASAGDAHEGEREGGSEEQLAWVANLAGA
jgi:hypothetical protein